MMRTYNRSCSFLCSSLRWATAGPRCVNTGDCQCFL